MIRYYLNITKFMILSNIISYIFLNQHSLFKVQDINRTKKIEGIS
jgi:hypothetical protein